MSFSDQANNDGNTNTPAADQPAGNSEGTPTLTVNGKTLTLDEAAKKLENQDQFIETLKSERAKDVEVNETLASRLDNLESAVQTKDGLENLLKNLTTAPVAAPAPSETPAVQQVSTEELTEAVKASLQKEQIVEKQKANMQSSMSAARAAYGDDYANKIIELGREAGYDIDGVDDLANNHPTAFAKLFLPEAKPATPGLNTDSSVSAPAAGTQDPAPAERKTWSQLKTSAARSADIAARIAAKEAEYNK